jgi:hypothetical protein
VESRGNVRTCPTFAVLLLRSLADTIRTLRRPLRRGRESRLALRATPLKDDIDDTLKAEIVHSLGRALCGGACVRSSTPPYLLPRGTMVESSSRWRARSRRRSARRCSAFCCFHVSKGSSWRCVSVDCSPSCKECAISACIRQWGHTHATTVARFPMWKSRTFVPK